MQFPFCVPVLQADKMDSQEWLYCFISSSVTYRPLSPSALHIQSSICCNWKRGIPSDCNNPANAKCCRGRSSRPTGPWRYPTPSNHEQGLAFRGRQRLPRPLQACQTSTAIFRQSLFQRIVFARDFFLAAYQEFQLDHRAK